MSIVIRFVTTCAGKMEIREHFVGFIPVTDTTGEGLTESLLKELNEMEIPLSNMRGQGYDNGSNMKGKKAGVQNRIKLLNPRATFIPCAAHSLNLVISDAASSSGETINFFNLIQELYVFFSKSTSRWHVLKKHVKKLNLKPVCETRWESRISAITPLRFQIEEIYDALVEIHLDKTRDSIAQSTAKGLSKQISCFKFLCSLVLWHDILSKINIVSKMMQSPNLYLNVFICINIFSVF